MYYLKRYTSFLNLGSTQPKKKNEILPFAATWMDLEGIMISEMNLTEKDKFCMISLIDGILKIQQVSEYSKKEADPQLWRAS